jgi:hypothetical protein
MDGGSFPMPVGIGFSVSPLAAGMNSQVNALPPGYAVMVFQPIDPNNPGVATLYDSNNNVILTMNAGGYSEFSVPAAGASYYFSSTAGATLLAAVIPNHTTRPV